MKRWPVLLTAGLILMWLLLNGTFSPGQLLLGTVLAVVTVLAFRTVRPVQPRMRKPGVALALLGRVMVDIFRSNVAVAAIILGLARERHVRSGFLEIPLELRDPHGLAVLAAIVTSTPGTVWVDLSRDGRTLTLHVLDLHDEGYWTRLIKNRYERALIEIFE